MQVQSNTQLKQLKDFHGHPSSNRRDTSLIEGDTFYIHEEPITGIQYDTNSKLRILATQLGECCMTTDLAALMSQKRNAEPTTEVEEIKEEEHKYESGYKLSHDMRVLSFSLFSKILKEMTVENLIWRF